MNVKFLDAIFGILVFQPELSTTQEAAASVVNRYSEKSTRIFTVDIEIRSGFIASLDVSVVLNESTAEPPRRTDSYLLFSRTVGSAINLFDSMDAFEKDALWIILLSSNDNLKDLFETLFGNGILNLIVMYADNEVVNIYTYFPFNPKNCYDFEPVLVNQFIDGNFSQDVNLSPSNKIENLHRCPVSVFLYPLPPEVSFPGKGPPMNEQIAELFSLVQLKMNFTPEFSFALNIPNGTDAMMRNRRIIGFGLASITPRVAHGSPLADRYSHGVCLLNATDITV